MHEKLKVSDMPIGAVFRWGILLVRRLGIDRNYVIGRTSPMRDEDFGELEYTVVYQPSTGDQT